MPTIALQQASKYYKPKGRRGERRTETGVEDVDLTIRQGEFVFLTGSSGAGKSTLLHLMTGELRPSRGSVLVDGRSLSAMMLLSRGRAGLLFGKVPQHGSLIRKLTIQENLLLAARIGRGFLETPRKTRLRMEKVLGLVGMKGVQSRYPAELSIGEARRVELARALINSPPILALDEITASLDDDTIWDIFHLLTELNRQGTTVVMATHAGAFVNILRRRVVTLVDGRVAGDVEKGRYGDVMPSPSQIR